jgi:predicted transcriptional regulator
MVLNIEWGMTKEQATKLAGSQSELARILGISRAAVSQWRQMPEGRVWQLKVLRPEWFLG